MVTQASPFIRQVARELRDHGQLQAIRQRITAVYVPSPATLSLFAPGKVPHEFKKYLRASFPTPRRRRLDDMACAQLRRRLLVVGRVNTTEAGDYYIFGYSTAPSVMDATRVEYFVPVPVMYLRCFHPAHFDRRVHLSDARHSAMPASPTEFPAYDPRYVADLVRAGDNDNDTSPTPQRTCATGPAPETPRIPHGFATISALLEMIGRIETHLTAIATTWCPSVSLQTAAACLTPTVYPLAPMDCDQHDRVPPELVPYVTGHVPLDSRDMTLDLLATVMRVATPGHVHAHHFWAWHTQYGSAVHHTTLARQLNMWAANVDTILTLTTELRAHDRACARMRVLWLRQLTGATVPPSVVVFLAYMFTRVARIVRIDTRIVTRAGLRCALTGRPIAMLDTVHLVRFLVTDTVTSPRTETTTGGPLEQVLVVRANATADELGLLSDVEADQEAMPEPDTRLRLEAIAYAAVAHVTGIVQTPPPHTAASRRKSIAWESLIEHAWHKATSTCTVKPLQQLCEMAAPGDEVLDEEAMANDTVARFVASQQQGGTDGLAALPSDQPCGECAQRRMIRALCTTLRLAWAHTPNVLPVNDIPLTRLEHALKKWATALNVPNI